MPRQTHGRLLSCGPSNPNYPAPGPDLTITEINRTFNIWRRRYPGPCRFRIGLDPIQGLPALPRHGQDWPRPGSHILRIRYAHVKQTKAKAPQRPPGDARAETEHQPGGSVPADLCSGQTTQSGAAERPQVAQWQEISATRNLTDPRVFNRHIRLLRSSRSTMRRTRSRKPLVDQA